MLWIISPKLGRIQGVSAKAACHAAVNHFVSRSQEPPTIMSTPQELVACIEKLASLPAAYHRIRELLDDPDSSVYQVADAVASAQERLRVGKLQGRHLQEGFDLFGHGGQHGL